MTRAPLPPSAVATFGLMLVTTGITPAVYDQAFGIVTLPSGVTRTMSPAPDPACAVTTTWRSAVDTIVAGVPARVTADTAASPSPRMVTVVPPASGPKAGLAERA